LSYASVSWCVRPDSNRGWESLPLIKSQVHSRVPAPKGNGYMINVASAKNGVGYGAWAHIDGWSEAVIEYIRELERSEAR